MAEKKTEEAKEEVPKGEPGLNKRQLALTQRQQNRIKYLKAQGRDKDTIRTATRNLTYKNEEKDLLSTKQEARIKWLKSQGRDDDALKVRNKAREGAGLKAVRTPKPEQDIRGGRVQTGRDRGPVQTGRDRAGAQKALNNAIDSSKPNYGVGGRRAIDKGQSDVAASGSKKERVEQRLAKKPLKPPTNSSVKHTLKKSLKPW